MVLNESVTGFENSKKRKKELASLTNPHSTSGLQRRRAAGFLLTNGGAFAA